MPAKVAEFLGPAVELRFKSSYDELKPLFAEITRAFFEVSEGAPEWAPQMSSIVKRVQEAVARNEVPDFRGWGSFTRLEWKLVKGTVILDLFHKKVKSKAECQDPELMPLCLQQHAAIQAVQAFLKKHNIRYELIDIQE